MTGEVSGFTGSLSFADGRSLAFNVAAKGAFDVFNALTEDVFRQLVGQMPQELKVLLSDALGCTPSLTSYPTPGPVPAASPLFTDSRGTIHNLLNTSVGSVTIITSTKGAVRANHYHLTDAHFCFVLSGAVEYAERPAHSDEPPTVYRFRSGEMFWTGNLVEHAMRFPEDTVFLTLARNNRNTDAYEDDVVRVPDLWALVK